MIVPGTPALGPVLGHDLCVQGLQILLCVGSLRVRPEFELRETRGHNHVREKIGQDIRPDSLRLTVQHLRVEGEQRLQALGLRLTYVVIPVLRGIHTIVGGVTELVDNSSDVQESSVRIGTDVRVPRIAV